MGITGLAEVLCMQCYVQSLMMQVTDCIWIIITDGPFLHHLTACFIACHSLCCGAMAALVTHPDGQSAFALSQIAQLSVESTFVAKFYPQIPHMKLAVAYSDRHT